MKLVIQRVSSANVSVNNKTVGAIEKGLLILIGITHEDKEDDVDYLVNKAINMRIFNDDAGLMNLSLLDINGAVLLISQFTLYANTKKGNRPSFIDASKPIVAIPLYEKCISVFENCLGKDKVQTGIFGADMKVSLVNDGPVTIIINSKKQEVFEVDF